MHDEAVRKRQSLRVATLNATKWSAARRTIERWAKHTDRCPQVVCIQEHHLLHEERPAAEMWCLTMGWKPVFEPAHPTGGGDSTGGVAVLVRAHFGVQREQPWPEDLRHRGVSALVEIMPGASMRAHGG